MKKVVLITVHGMGSTPSDYNHDLKRRLLYRLGDNFDKLHIGSVYYQDILQSNELRVWHSMESLVNLPDLRKFLLFGFADAAGLESDKELTDSVYTKAQASIASEMYKAYKASEQNSPVIILAQSLGCQVASCYFWDAIKKRSGQVVHAGFWKDLEVNMDAAFSGDKPTAEALEFMQGSTFRQFFTTGCNIPIFVAAHAKDDIKPIRPNDDFSWFNFYDKDDVLGWPLAPLSPQYGETVEDYEINADGGFLGWVTSSWNPLSHSKYWDDNEVITPLVAAIESHLKE